MSSVDVAVSRKLSHHKQCELTAHEREQVREGLVLPERVSCREHFISWRSDDLDHHDLVVWYQAFGRGGPGYCKHGQTMAHAVIKDPGRPTERTTSRCPGPAELGSMTVSK